MVGPPSSDAKQFAEGRAPCRWLFGTGQLESGVFSHPWPAGPFTGEAMDLILHLVSDLDGTWIPHGSDLQGLRNLESHLSRLRGFELTFATGRSLHSVITELPRIVRLWPQHLVTDVGTAIHYRTSKGKWIEDGEYGRRIALRWDTESAERLATSLPSTVRRQAGVRSRRRLALEVAPGCDPQRSLDDLIKYLEKSWFAADVLASNGRCLDVLPRGVHKGTAVEYLGRSVRHQTFLMVCGDSENDLGMLRLADAAVLMASSPLQEERIGLRAHRIYRPEADGPAGILEALTRLQFRDNGRSVPGPWCPAPPPATEVQHG